MAHASFVNDQLAAGNFEKITVSTTAVGPDANLISVGNKRCVRALLTIEGAAVRLRFDGTDPDSSTGHLIAAGDFFTVDGVTNVSRIRLIRGGGSDATVQITYFLQ